MALSPQWLDDLRARITLSTLIGRTVKVQKAGREFKACCPFHNEKTPSFTINDEKGFYHCFGCGAHGDAISWMTEQRGLGFMDAVKDLAVEAQMEVPAPDPQAAKRQEARATLHDVMAAAQDWFVTQFNGIEGAQAREYLKNRGIAENTIREFGFGFAPNSRGKLKDALSGHGIDLLIEGGLLIKVEDKDPYDRFRGRLMIPIRDPRGRVIAFGGRILGDGEPKYLNSPDTPLFDKGRTLYNLDKASPASRQTGRILVVEGYMDAIALAQAGFEDVVAPLGTALTEHQIERIWKMVEAPILCFDGDNAGQKAAMRAAERALPRISLGHSLQFINLPFGVDPDDYLKTQGRKEFEQLIDKSETLDVRLWRRERAKIGRDPGPNQRAEMRVKLNGYADSIADPIFKSEYRKTFNDFYFDEFGSKSKRFGQLKNVIDEAYGHPIDKALPMMHRAILLGVMRYPKVLSSKFDQISKLPIEDRYLKNWRDLLMLIRVDDPEADEDLLEELLVRDGLEAIAKRNIQTDLRYSFYSKHDNPKMPIEQLEKVIDAIIHDYEIGISLSDAEKKVLEAFSEENLVQMQKIRETRAASKMNLYETVDLVTGE